MKRRNTFTAREADVIRDLLRQKIESGNEKRFRDKLRSMGFYISDYPRRADGFSPSDFDEMIAAKRIIVE